MQEWSKALAAPLRRQASAPALSPWRANRRLAIPLGARRLGRADAREFSACRGARAQRNGRP
eukprot:6632785-Pyramimonas_sp.AAC.1